MGFRWKESHRQEWAGPGRVAADREAGADYAGHAEICGRSNKLVIIRSEALAITRRKSVNEIIE